MTADQPDRAEDGAWRDEDRLPLRDLSTAMATYAADGQTDDASGGDAGAASSDEAAEDSADPDRRWRPSPDGPGPAGHSGPS